MKSDQSLLGDNIPKANETKLCPVPPSNPRDIQWELEPTYRPGGVRTGPEMSRSDNRGPPTLLSCFVFEDLPCWRFHAHIKSTAAVVLRPRHVHVKWTLETPFLFFLLRDTGHGSTSGHSLDHHTVFWYGPLTSHSLDHHTVIWYLPLTSHVDTAWTIKRSSGTSLSPHTWTQLGPSNGHLVPPSHLTRGYSLDHQTVIWYLPLTLH